MNQNYAVSELYEWFKTNKDYFISKKAKIEFRDSGYNSAFVRIDTEAYLIQLDTWDNASCLDIQILEQKTESSTFPQVGECKSKDVFQSHLHDFLMWFKDEV